MAQFYFRPVMKKAVYSSFFSQPKKEESNPYEKCEKTMNDLYATISRNTNILRNSLVRKNDIT